MSKAKENCGHLLNHYVNHTFVAELPLIYSRMMTASPWGLLEIWDVDNTAL